MADNYEISAQLVHKLIGAIIAAILAIGGYMALWAISDASWKARMDERWAIVREAISNFDSELDEHKGKPCHDVACERLRNLPSMP